MRRFIVWLALGGAAIFIVATDPAAAQNPFEALGSGHGVFVSARWDPAPLVAVGYRSGFHAPAVDRAAAFDIELRKPVFLPGWRDVQLRIGARIELASPTSGTLVNGLSLVIHSQDNARMRGLGIGVEERLMAGRAGESGFGAADAGFTWFARNRIRFKSSGETSWYRGAGGKFTLGGAGGYQTSGGTGLSFDAALVKTAGRRNFNPAGPPVRAGLTVGRSGL